MSEIWTAPTIPHMPSAAEVFFKKLERHYRGAVAALKDGEHLRVQYCTKAGEILEVGNMHYEAPHLMTVEGLDAQGNRVQAMVNVDSFELILRVERPATPIKRTQIGFHMD